MCGVILCYPQISIHALRVEGDHGCMRFKDLQAKISIHALRVEGDSSRFKR